VIFAGHLCVETANAILHPGHLRWKDIFWLAERAGANAVGIVTLLGFLFGLIMAFSSAMPLRQFGVEVFVSDLVAIALIRVLGPFITAIIMAGRTSSSYAAELGTMKVNEEIDALTTMGLEPVRFLVVPRVLTTVVVTPLLAVLANIAGLIGSGIVMLVLGFPLVTYTNHVKSSIDAGDVFAGLFKALVYGGIVGAIGCLRGLETKGGASSVGISTTKAVVSGIILIVIAEGMFAVLYHYLGI
jgi:phospholipid/cholesterol/gamma-HCH transport system permease protein